MGEKDTKAKAFLANNERFADLFNYYLFNGKQVIKAADLCERDTTKVLSVLEQIRRRYKNRSGVIYSKVLL